ncbi:hypothetical protein [Streptobacillus moniliformis]|uniref:hypothetical protein n=1 Tax=Streptobacillus moniliformis TaxID=34105 RepID=UPI0001A3A42D|nr:hypothetical protein [Streptobacillus moniliformis]
MSVTINSEKGENRTRLVNNHRSGNIFSLIKKYIVYIVIMHLIYIFRNNLFVK